ncbi:MAG: cytochrome c3 family protein [candidate division Zixibacteria bacterium]|nr:cytochrome c3 family protein [candidate division Zixibacteria bacterium]
MAQIFPKWTNNIQTYLAVLSVFLAVAAVAFIWYYFSPWYTDVGYQPLQPVAYSHRLHAGDLGIDCRYCHNFVEYSPHANIPATQTCMNCHNLILPESEKLLPVRESRSVNFPLQWIRVHKIPDYAYFNHSLHLKAGVGCASCHDDVSRMDIVILKMPLSMSWCLDCHRHPDNHLRPPQELTSMDWQPSAEQAANAEKVIQEMNINPPVTDCSGCHR